MKLEEEVDLTGTGETNEGSHGKQEGEVQEGGTCRATPDGQWRKKNTMQELRIEMQNPNIRREDIVFIILPRANQNR